MEQWVRRSWHFTEDGEAADYFWIPPFQCIDKLDVVLEVCRHAFPTSLPRPDTASCALCPLRGLNSCFLLPRNLTQVFRHIRTDYPYWNRTKARHIMSVCAQIPFSKPLLL